MRGSDPTLRLTFNFCSAVFTYSLIWGIGECPGQGVSDVEISSLVARLGDGSFEVREESTLRLLELGHRAGAALKRAVGGDDYEIAIRARDLLRVFEELLFAGVSVEISASRKVFDWSDPVELTLRLENTGSQVGRLPFEIISPEDDKRTERLRQFTSLLDLSEYLVVEGPDGRPVRLHVDDIDEDPEIRAVVDDRVEDSVVSEIAPRSKVTYRVAAFNRGSVRYRLLEAGEYHLQLVYQPQWDDQQMVRSGVGRVVSNRLKLTVAHPAPMSIRRATAPADLLVTRDGDDIVASLVSRFDLPMWINLNLSNDRGAPFARARWLADCGEQRRTLPGRGKPESVGGKFSRDRVIRVMPGDTIELARRSYKELSEAAGGCSVRFTYSSIVNRSWVRSNLAGAAAGLLQGKGRDQPLPYGMLVTTLTSDVPQASTSE